MSAWLMKLFVAIAVCLAIGTRIDADDSLHVIIDRHLATSVASYDTICSDAEFLRRVSLDLIGVPPTADETRSFLADAAADKRQQLIDRLLASPLFDRHMATTLDLMLMERRANTNVTQDEWYAWLHQSVKDNKPWNTLAHEILNADGSDPAARAPARFYLDRGSEPNLIARDVGRIFFGRDFQCAQCHDHPIVADYLQLDYQGLLAFFTPGYEVKVKQGDKEVSVYAERAGTDLQFESVFIKGIPHRTAPRLPDVVAVNEPFFYPGDEYSVPPADKTRSVPKFSRRAQLAELATSGSNRAFNENMANRLWAHLLGRGLIHPVDLHNPGNAPADAALLKLLGEHFAQVGFDMRAFLREVAMSRVYQRPFDAPAGSAASTESLAALLQELETGQVTLSETADASDAAYEAAKTAFYAAEAAVLPVAKEYDAARKTYAEAAVKLAEATTASSTAQSQLTNKQNAIASLKQAAESTQQAAASLGDDAALATAAKSLADKATALEAELPALQTAAETAAAALPAPTEAVAAAKGPLDEALAKRSPLDDALRAAEENMLLARRKVTEDKLAQEASWRRERTLESLAKVPELKQTIAAAEQVLIDSEAAVKQTTSELAEYVAVLAERDAAVAAASQAMSAATTRLTTATKLQQLQQAAIDSLVSAVEASKFAAVSLPADTSIAETSAVLETKLATLRQQLVPLQQDAESAAAQADVAAKLLTEVTAQRDATLAEQARRQEQLTALQAKISATNEELAAGRMALAEAGNSSAEKLANDFTLSCLKPLTPEQLCWSVFQVTAVYDSYWQAEVAALDQESPLTEEQKNDAVFMAARERTIEQRTYDKLKGNVGTFVTYYGIGAGQPQNDFFATVDQALFAANGGSINSWTVQRGNNVNQRIVVATDPKTAAEELYLGVLTRMPTDEETADVARHLENQPDRVVAASELVWGLLNSAEFRFNH